MRKLAVMGAVSAAMLGAAMGAQAATQTYNINGTLANSVNSCFNIAVSLTGTDCSYARTHVPAIATATGPKFVGAFYPKGSAGDSISYNPVPNDGKLSPAVSGTVTIDDAGTPADGTDDLISATWIIAGAAFNASTGNGDRAIERWDSFTQVMAPTAVNAAIAQGGGFEYVIGSRKVTNLGGTSTVPTGIVQIGKPSPDPLCLIADPTNCFPSESAPATQDPPGDWETTFAGLANPADNRIGIERSVAFGLYPNGRPEPSPNPNIGATTTGTITNYVCIDVAGDNDCISSESLFGSSAIKYRKENSTTLPAVDPAIGDCADGIDNDADGKIDLVPGNEDPECIPKATASAQGIPADPNKTVGPPGFDNVVLVLTTDGAGNITRANAYWTREYIISSGPPAGPDPNGTFTVDNSYQAGRISFTGAQAAADPVAVADNDLPVIQDTATALAVLANDTLGGGTNVITIEGAGPANGTAVPGATDITYTPDLHFSGNDTFQYRLTDDDGGFSVATVTVVVSNKLPVAGNFTASSSGGNPTSAIPVLGSPTVLGTGTAAEHTVTVTGAATGGTCAVSGTGASQAVQFTPTAGFNGTGSCDFQIADASTPADTDTGTLNVSVSGNGGGGGGGVSGPQLPSGGSSLDLLSLGALLAGLPLLRRRRRVARQPIP